ncbi:MAG: hypothetical protein QGH51_06475 [Planctomycetota bacterium]|nr:hypothetical protein [Planctomycetota bacterium]
MKIITKTSPVALHFGALDTRLLQLEGGPGGWSVRSASIYSAQGKARHAQAAEQVAEERRALRLIGKDALIGISSDAVSVNLVPIDDNNRGRLQQVLKDTATRSSQDSEGLEFRYIPITGSEMVGSREDYLLLTVGASELRRCRAAVESLGMRPAGMEMGAFPIARALQEVHSGEEDPWGFLHLGFGQSLFGVVHQGEICFLKPMQLTGSSLLSQMEITLSNSEKVGPSVLFDAPSTSDGQIDSNTISNLHQQSVGHAVELLHSLKSEAESIAQEIRACLRHFATRNKGARMSCLELTGFGSSLPEVENALGKSLDLPVGLATPFLSLGIQAPPQVRAEEHLWCTALGLAMRGEQ